jgi:GTPase SAR1 family protein
LKLERLNSKPLATTMSSFVAAHSLVNIESNKSNGKSNIANKSKGGHVNCQKAEESCILFVGDKQSGKSTLINHFLGTHNKGLAEDRDKPTLAMQYYFARAEMHSKDSGVTTDSIANIWEFGGGIPKAAIEEFLSIPLHSDRVKTSLVVIVINLAAVEDVIPSLVEWLRLTRTVVMACSKGEQHPGSKRSNGNSLSATKTEFPVPLLIVGNKYDSFLRVEKTKRDAITMALRSLACINCATLVFACNHDEKAKEHYRIVSRQLFFTRVLPKRRSSSSNPEHSCTNPLSFDGPLLIWANCDSYENIVKEIPCTPIFSEPESNDKGSVFSRVQMISSTQFWLTTSERYFGEPSKNCVSSSVNVEEEFVLPKNAIIDKAIDAAKLVYL